MRFPTRSATKRLKGTAKVVLEGEEEKAIWRHQLIGQRNPLAHNATGQDPAGMYWKTKDHVVTIQRQGSDPMGRSIIYGQFEPVRGDLIVTLYGQPRTNDQVLRAPRVGFYVVDDYDVRRDADGRIIYVKIMAIADRSGQYNDYDFHGGDPL